MSVLSVNDLSFQAKVLDSKKPVLVDFWAPWCGPCRMMGPVMEALAEEVGDEAVVAKVNIDDATETATRYGIQSIPTFAVIKDGEVVTQLGGVVTQETLREALVG